MKIFITKLDVKYNKELFLYLKENGYEVFGEEDIRNEKVKLEEVDLLINGITYMNEMELFKSTEEVINKIRVELKDLYSINKQYSKIILAKKAGGIIFLTNLDYIHDYAGNYSPIYNGAVNSFMLSLHKELVAFKCYCFGIDVVCGTIDEIRIFQKRIRGIIPKVTISSPQEQYEKIQKLILVSDILSGQKISLGDYCPSLF